jgi:hypothetical protein
MRTLIALAALAAAAAPAAAQQKDDPFNGIKMGDRVELTLKSEFAIRGRLVQTAVDETKFYELKDGRLVPREGSKIAKADHLIRTEKISDQLLIAVYADPAVEIAKQDTVLVDVGMEYPDLTGQMGVPRVNVKAVRKLRELTAEEAREIERQRLKALEDLRDTEKKRLASAAKDAQARRRELEEAEKRRLADEATKTAAELKRQAELIEKAKAVYEKFPPEKYNPKALAEVVQRQNVLKQNLPPDWKEYSENIELWQQYHDYINRKAEKEKEKEKEQPPKETPKETPKEEPKEPPKPRPID